MGPITLAALNGHADVVHELLKAADDERHSLQGASALHLAASAGFSEVVTLLCEKGADVNVTTADGATALMLAKSANQQETVETLLALNKRKKRAEKARRASKKPRVE
eukprot:g1873.t1